MKVVLLLSVVFTFVGCTSVEKATKVMRSHPVELAKLCLDCFGDKTKPTIVKGDTNIVKIDTTINIDTTVVIADCPDGTKVVVDCPTNKTITTTVHTHSTDSVLSDTWQTKAKVKLLEDENEKLKAENKELKEQNAKEVSSKVGWRKLALWVLGLNALYFGGRFVIARIKNRGLI